MGDRWVQVGDSVAPHKKLIVWQKSFNLAREVYKLTDGFPKSERFGITQQIRRAVISIVSNIAEGASRVSGKEKIQFFVTARGSLVELETQLLLAKELKYFDKREDIFNEITEIGELLNGLIQNRRKSLKLITYLLSPIAYLLAYLLTPITLFGAAFMDHGWSVRAEGMGGAFTSISDDPNAIFYNPSGLTQLLTKEINLMYTKSYLGVEGVDISFMRGVGVYPTDKYGNFGLGITHYNVNDLYSENMIIIGYGYNLARLLKVDHKLLVGINLKYLRWSVDWDEEIKKLNDPVVQSGNWKGAFGIDIGILSELVEKLKIGFMGKNLNSPDIGLYYENKIPPEVSLGVSYNFGDINPFKGFILEDFTPAINLSYRAQDYGNRFRYSVGLETWFKFHTFGLRLGFNGTDFALGGSYYPYLRGGTVQLKIDYAVLISTVFIESLGSHKISFGIEF